MEANDIPSLNDVVGWRRALHARPELGFDEHETAAFVADKLREFGCDEVATGIGKTGVVGVIHGKIRESGKAIGLRADMDALPIEEATGASWTSQCTGKMHACGHDGHTAMLLGAARELARTRNFNGTAVVVFQPAEEGMGGGKAMVDEGLMLRFGIDEIYAMHNEPGLAIGQFATTSGPIGASANVFRIMIGGKGGHGASPHDCIDPILVGAHIIVARKRPPSGVLRHFGSALMDLR